MNTRLITPWLSVLLLVYSCEKPSIVPDPGPDPTPEIPSEPEVIEYDGQVKSLMEASKGKGLDIVIVGDGFTEDDFLSGNYDTTMETACRYLFSQEPMSSLKEYFNVWSVGVVSADSKLDGTSGLKCEGVYPGNSTEKIVDSYGAKVPGVEVDSTVFCIIINSKANGGWTTHQSYHTQKAYAFCPMIESTPHNQYYKLALIHETIGHGFAKLSDEYVKEGYQDVSPSARDKSDLIAHQKLGYDLNLSFSKEPAECPWKDFLDDPRYVRDGIGFYEGAGYYGKNAYHPTRTNLMNTTWGIKMEFNAPSRKAIYDRVIKRGEKRTPSYEEFVIFDKKLH